MHRLALIAPLVMATAAQAGPGGFWPVGLPEGGSYGYVGGLSWDGSVGCGDTYIGGGAPKPQPGFRWTAAGGRDDWGLQAGMPPRTITSAISSDGSTLVGRMVDDSIKLHHAFRRIGDGSLESLGLLPKETRSYATGISGNGQVIVGTCEHGIENAFGQAFRWTEAGGMQGLGYLNGVGTFSKAYGISRDGTTIVGMSQKGGSGGDVEAFSWTEAEGVKKLPDLPGSPFQWTEARAVNSGATVVVGVAPSPSDGKDRAVRWVGGAIEDLGVLPGYNRSRALAVSDDGSIIGGTASGNDGLRSAILWTEDSGMVRLADFLAGFGVDVPADYRLDYVYAISGDGVTFAGEATNLVTNDIEGFVATIPSPPSLLIFATPFFVARRKRG